MIDEALHLLLGELTCRLNLLLPLFLHYESQNNMFLKHINDVTLSDLHATAYKAMLLRQEYSLLWWLVPSFIFPLPWLKSFTCEH